MKTAPPEYRPDQRPDQRHDAAAIVLLTDSAAGHDALQRARVFAEPLLAGQRLDTGEEALDRKSVV